MVVRFVGHAENRTIESNRTALVCTVVVALAAMAWVISGAPLGVGPVVDGDRATDRAPLARGLSTYEAVSNWRARSPVPQGVVVVDGRDGGPIEGAVVEFVREGGELIEARRSDEAGVCARPDAAFDGVAVFADGFGIVGANAAASRVALMPARDVEVVVEATPAMWRDFVLTVRLERYAAGTGEQAFAAACYHRSVAGEPVTVEGGRARVAHPLRAPGAIACDGRHRVTGVVVRLGDVEVAPDSRRVFLDLTRHYFAEPRGWVGVRVHLPRAISGAFRAKLLPSEGRSGEARAWLDAAHVCEIAALDGRAGPAELLDVFVGDAALALSADRVEVELEQDRFVDVAPWTATGRVELELDGLPEGLAESVPIEIRRVDEAEVAEPPRGRERVSMYHRRYEYLPAGRYGVRVPRWIGDDMGYRIAPVEVSLGDGASAVVTLRAERLAVVRVFKPADDEVDLVLLESGESVGRLRHLSEFRLCVPPGIYRATHRWAEGERFHDVRIDVGGVTLRFP